MTEVDASIPLKATVPDGMNTLKSILDVRAKQQNLQTGQIQQQRQGVQLQQEQGALDARNSVAKVMQDPALRDPETGLMDLNKLAPAIQAADPKNYVWHEALKKTAEVNGDLMKVKALGMNLGDQEQAFIGQRMGIVALNPNATKEDAYKALDDAVSVAPGAKPVADIVRKNINGLDKPGTVAPVLAQFRNFGFPLAAQQPQTTMVGTGANTQPMQSNLLSGPVASAGQPIANTVPPTAAEEIVTDAQGNKYRQVKGPDGRITIQPIQASGGPGGPGPAPTTQPMMTLPPGESQASGEALRGERQAALQTLAGAPVMHLTNRGVLEEIDKATTGTLGPRMASVMSAAGVSLPKGWGGASAEEKASAYDLVGKYLERNAITAAQSMGPHTNAGLESQIKAQGSVAYNPTAIKKITQLNDALVTGSEHYQPGLEKAITSSPDQIFAKRKYDQQWAQNFDPRVMMLFNAQTNGKPGEVQELIKSWGGKDSIVTKEILRKAKNLDMLSTEGHL